MERNETPSSSNLSQPDSSQSQVVRHDNFGNPYVVTNRGINAQGNEYSSREYIQPDGSTAPGYQYSNVDGSYFYSNPDGSKYHNNGDSKTRYTSADGSGWEKKIFAATAASNLSSQSQTSTRVTNSEEVQHIRGTVGAEPASTAGTAGPQLKSQAERVDFSARLDEIFTSYGAGYDHGYKDGYNDGCDDEA